MQPLPDLVACDGLGKYLSLTSPLARDQCCFVSSQNSTACRRLFAPDSSLDPNPKTGETPLNLLDAACLGRPPAQCHLLNRCRSPSTLYVSVEQLNTDDTNPSADGALLLARYKACANLPGLILLSRNGLLTPYIDAVVRAHIDPPLGPDESELDMVLGEITLAATDCLSATCRGGRDRGDCFESVCSPVRLMRNGTLPDVRGVNGCLNRICSAGTGALPWADADIVGVGVFTSYVMQCLLVVVLWAGLAGFSWHNARRGRPDRPPKEPHQQHPNQPPHDHPDKPKQQEQIGPHFQAWISLLLDSHKAQCYFGGTLMLAVLASDLFSTSFVTTFLVTPLATNSILPLIFSYLLLVYFRASTPATAILTTVVYVLASLVYWVLYIRLRLPDGMTRDGMYKRYRLGVSSLEACGEFSGLAVCPEGDADRDEFAEGIGARLLLRVVTPIIWTWATGVLGVLLLLPVFRRSGRRSRQGKKMERELAESGKQGDENTARSTGDTTRTWHRVVFWLSTVVFVLGVGMQGSVLATAIRLDMVDIHGWSFGQIVAVTVWVPPLLEYFCGEMSGWHRRRMGKWGGEYEEVPMR